MSDKPDFISWRVCQTILATITLRGGEARFVGGAVRNHLMGLPSDDVDMAVNRPITEVARWLIEAGVGVYETGIQHGTITVRQDEKSVELTQTRKDTNTDGRHAEVVAIDDWQEDAKRRDFTVNAIYMDEQGALFDPLEGAADIKAGKLAFIGAAEMRIKEDYLRILRGFRLMSEYPELKLTNDSIKAIRRQLEGLSVLSGERISSEWMRLLAGRGWRQALKAASEAGLDDALLGCTLPHNFDAPLADKLSALGRFAWLLGAGSALPGWLLLSRVDTDLLSLYLQKLPNDHALALLSDTDWQQQAYWLGGSAHARLMLSILWDDIDSHAHKSIDNNLALLETFKIPSLPLRGADLIKEGFAPGPKLGQTLKALEIKWVESGFQLNHTDLMALVVKEYNDE